MPVCGLTSRPGVGQTSVAWCSTAHLNTFDLKPLQNLVDLERNALSLRMTYSSGPCINIYQYISIYIYIYINDIKNQYYIILNSIWLNCIITIIVWEWRAMLPGQGKTWWCKYWELMLKQNSEKSQRLEVPCLGTHSGQERHRSCSARTEQYRCTSCGLILLL